jgi:hypothetical protein
MARRGTGIISVLITGDASPLNKSVSDAGSMLDGFGKKIGAAMAVAGAAVGAAAFKIGKDAVSAASDLAESVNAVNVAFGEAAQGVLKLGETSAQSMGVSQREFNQAAVRFSAFAERVVGQGGDISGFIGDISVRAADFASVFNIDVAEALQVFQSGLSGEAEPLKRFGINLLQSEVQAYALRAGLIAVGEQMTEEQKVQARYGLLMEATAKTAGDFANTSDGLANSQRILKARFDDTLASLGQALLPAVTSIAQFLLNVGVPAFERLGAVITQFQPQITALANVFTQNLGQGSETLRRFTDILNTYLLPILRSIFLPALAGLRTAFGFIRDSITENSGKFQEFGERLIPLATFVRDTLAPLIGGVLRIAFEVLGKSIGVAIGFFADILGIIGRVIDKVVELSRRIAESPLGAGISRVVDAIVGRQFGGQVTAGTPYLVGEAGPELFVPSRSGQIIGNGDMGGGSVNVYVTSADPQAVVDAIRRYTRTNGPLGQAVPV